MIKALLPIVFTFQLALGLHANDSKGLREALRHHVEILASDSLEGRGLGTDGAERARRYISGQYEAAGISPWFKLSDDYFQPFRIRERLSWVDAKNIVGFIEGSDPVLKNEYIVIGAHYDHLGYEIDDNNQRLIYPGADDNASGVSAIIELGKHFAANPHLLKRSLLIIAFDAEESGLLGAEFFVNNLPVDKNNIKFMFSLDMVGMLNTYGKLDIKGIGSAVNLSETSIQVAQNHDLAIGNSGKNIERRTDTAPFADAGIPAAHVFTGLKSPYHKPEDTSDLLDYEGMVIIHGFMTDLIIQISAKPKIIPDHQIIPDADEAGSTKTQYISAGLTMYVGSGYHQYKDEFFQANPAVIGAIGLFVQIPLSSVFSIQQDVIYDMNGSQAQTGVFRRYSLTLPLQVQIGTPRISFASLRTYVSAGPYFRYNFAGSDGEKSLDFKIYQQQEWGYSLGWGFDIFDFTIGFTRRSSLTSLFLNKPEQPNILDNNHYFTIGYRF
jgi:hypothetical protein